MSSLLFCEFLELLTFFEILRLTIFSLCLFFVLNEFSNQVFEPSFSQPHGSVIESVPRRWSTPSRCIKFVQPTTVYWERETLPLFCVEMNSKWKHNDSNDEQPARSPTYTNGDLLALIPFFCIFFFIPIGGVHARTAQHAHNLTGCVWATQQKSVTDNRVQFDRLEASK